MSLSSNDIVQDNNGASTTGSSSVVVSLPSGTTAGNTVIVILSTFVGGMTLPTGFVNDGASSASSHGLLVARKSNVAAAETSWTFTLSTSTNYTWYVMEVSELDVGEPLDAFISTTGTAQANGSTRSTGTTSANAGLDVLVIGAWGAADASVPGGGSWSNHTNGFEEVVDTSSTASGAVNNYSISVGRIFPGAVGPYESTATWTSVDGQAGSASYGLIVAYRSASSPILTPLTWQCGFEHGTHNGLTTTPLGLTAIVQGATGTIGTDIIVETASARAPSVYGCRLIQSASTKYLSVGSSVYGTSKNTLVLGWNLQILSSSGTVVLAEISPNSGTILQVLYNSSTSKIGLRWGAGTPSWESGTTPTSTWRWIDIRVTGVKTTTRHVDWRLETATDTYTDQTPPADLSGQAVGLEWSQVLFGGNTSQTVTQRLDDICISTFSGVYPMGPHTLRALTVDPAGTATLSGTAANFNVFTNNTTLGAWNATNARNAIDELPPTISASSDGVCQITTAATEYMQFPMETYTCSSTEVIASCRVISCLWGGTGTGTGTLGIRAFDGTTESTLQGTVTSYDADSLTTPGATVPPWSAYMWNPQGGWTQSKLDAAAIRIGFSTDATPDMGIHAVYLEVAIRQANLVRQLEVVDGSDTFNVHLNMNPMSGATASYVVTVPTGRSAVFSYTHLGTPNNVTVLDSESPRTITIQADSYGDVSELALVPNAV